LTNRPEGSINPASSRNLKPPALAGGVFTVVTAVVLGLVAGVFAMFLFILVAANIYEPLQPRFLPPNPSAEVFALFMLALYAIWLFVLWAIARKVGRLNFVLLFLFVLPLPSIVVAYEWGKSLRTVGSSIRLNDHSECQSQSGTFVLRDPAVALPFYARALRPTDLVAQSPILPLLIIPDITTASRGRQNRSVTSCGDAAKPVAPHGDDGPPRRAGTA